MKPTNWPLGFFAHPPIYFFEGEFPPAHIYIHRYTHIYILNLSHSHQDADCLPLRIAP